MTFIEMELTDGASITGTTMISLSHISEVEELGANVRLHMSSGNNVLITGMSFGAALNAVEGVKYMKMSKPETEEVREVEGELVGAEEPCC